MPWFVIELQMEDYDEIAKDNLIQIRQPGKAAPKAKH